MRISYTPEQEELRRELRSYFAKLVTPERREALSSTSGEVGEGNVYFYAVPGPVLPNSFDAEFSSYFQGIGAYGSATSLWMRRWRPVLMRPAYRWRSGFVSCCSWWVLRFR